MFLKVYHPEKSEHTGWIIVGDRVNVILRLILKL